MAEARAAAAAQRTLDFALEHTARSARRRARKEIKLNAKAVNPLTGGTHPYALHRDLTSQLNAAARRLLEAAPGRRLSPTDSLFFPRTHAAMAALQCRGSGANELRALIFNPDGHFLHDLLETFLLDMGIERRDLIDFCMERSPLLQRSLRAMLSSPTATGVRFLFTQCGIADLEINDLKAPGAYGSFSVRFPQ